MSTPEPAKLLQRAPKKPVKRNGTCVLRFRISRALSVALRSSEAVSMGNGRFGRNTHVFWRISRASEGVCTSGLESNEKNLSSILSPNSLKSVLYGAPCVNRPLFREIFLIF
ncbi:hypothetical protein L596_001986 [Steinernema carpocapsae]|uniref:Uncharacterized protein n=1 Tax=Steinernema carpocapsae TaxID=34508 RepID=A0A4U8UN70_STECR|nr:hypothetical protein L596_001986 [Steinernema carpocapsae]